MKMGIAKLFEMSEGQESVETATATGTVAVVAAPTGSASAAEERRIEQANHPTNVVQMPTTSVDVGADAVGFTAGALLTSEGSGRCSRSTTLAGPRQQQRKLTIVTKPASVLPPAVGGAELNRKSAAVVDQREVQLAFSQPTTAEGVRTEHFPLPKRQQAVTTEDREEDSALSDGLAESQKLGDSGNSANNSVASSLSATLRPSTEDILDDTRQEEIEAASVPTPMEDAGAPVLGTRGPQVEPSPDSGDTGDGRAFRNAEGVVLAEERLTAVRCYLRDNDPIFVRRNLKRLMDGTLVGLAVGETVTVARRCRGGENNEGGAGSVTRVLPNFFYDIKYVINGMEKHVDACFVEKTRLLQGNRKRRGNTPRCPDCYSFLHECTCVGFLDATATAAVEAPASMIESSIPQKSSLPRFKLSRSLKRPRSAIGKEAEIRDILPRERENERLAAKAKVTGAPDQTMGHRSSHEKKEDNDMDFECDRLKISGGRYEVGKTAEEQVPEVAKSEAGENVMEGSTASDQQEILKGSLEQRGGIELNFVDRSGKKTDDSESVIRRQAESVENAMEPRRFPGCKERIRELPERERDAQKSGEDTEALWNDNIEGNTDALQGDCGRVGMGVLLQVPGKNISDGVVDTIKEAAEQGCLGSIDDSRSGNAKQHLEENQSTKEWRPQKGDLVEVERRMTPGVNKPGGTARVVNVDSNTGDIDVRYVVEGGWERGIDSAHVSPAVLDIAVKRSTLGRCGHCGSLRVDCRQGCEFYTAPPQSRASAVLHVVSLRGSTLAQTENRRGSERSKGRKGKWGRHRHRSRLSGKRDIDQEQHSIIGRRRRYLPEGWNDEGEFVSDKKGVENEETGSGTKGEWDNQGGRRGVKSDIGETAPLWGHGLSISSGSSTDDWMAGSESPYIRRGFRQVASDTESESSSYVECLSVRPGRRTVDFSSSSSSDVDRSDRRSGLSDASRVGSSRRDSEEDNFCLLDGGVENRGWPRTAKDAGEGGAPRFLMPEGEEAARMLPSDIADPTRGVMDPVILQKELKQRLRQMEAHEAKDLEHDVAAVCRRVASPTTAGADRTLKSDMEEVLGRLKQTMRRLDVANNIFVRLEKLEVRWREGTEGENVWHRLDGLSQNLEQLRRDAGKAFRDYTDSSAAVGDASSSSADGCGSFSLSGSSSKDFDLERSSSRRLSAVAREALPRERLASGWNMASTSRAGTTPAYRKSRFKADGDGGGFSTARKLRQKGHLGKKRSRQTSPGEQERRKYAAAGKSSGTNGVRGSNRVRGRDWVSVEEEAEKDLLGLDYSMAVESGEEGGGNGQKMRVSSLSSSERSSSPCSSSSDTQSPLLPPQGSAVNRRGGGGLSSGRSDRSGAVHLRPSGPRNRRQGKTRRTERREGGGALVSSSAGGERSRRGSSARSGRGGGMLSGRALADRNKASLAVEYRGRSRYNSKGVSVPYTRPLWQINGRALVAELYQQRRAEQEAREGAQPPGKPIIVTSTGSGSVKHVHESVDPGGRMQLPEDPLPTVDQVQEVRRRKKEARRAVRPPQLSTLVEDLVSKPLLRRPLKFKTLFSKTSAATSVIMDNFKLEVGVIDPCALADDKGGTRHMDRHEDRKILADSTEQAPTVDENIFAAAENCEAGGGDEENNDMVMSDHKQRKERRAMLVGRGSEEEKRANRIWEEENGEVACSGNLALALDMLPQRMADLEELATTESLGGEANTLARECCKAMAVIGVKIRALFCPLGSCWSSNTNTWQLSRNRNLAAMQHIVKYLAESCAPGWGGGDSNIGGGGCFQGLSLIRAVRLDDAMRGSVGSKALLGACAAFHMHLLGWIAVAEDNCLSVASSGRKSDAPGTCGGISGASTLSSRARAESAAPLPEGSTQDFSQRLLLDLLFLFEKRLKTSQASGSTLLARRHGGADEAFPPPSSGQRNISKDPLAELLSTLIDTLNGTGHNLSAPRPAAKISIPGLARPLVGFWGVFFEVISNGPSAFFKANADSVGGRGWPNAGLPSELVWKALIYAFRVNALQRCGDDATSVDSTTNGATRIGDDSGGDGHMQEELQRGRSEAEAAATMMAHQRLRKEISKALWECVDLLLAASPFYVEFSGHGQASAVAVTSRAAFAAAAAARPGYNRPTARGAAQYFPDATSGANLSLLPPVVTMVGSFSSPGMVAQVLLERVLVLARFHPPEAGPQGVVEKLWEGVQRISGMMCVVRPSGVKAPEGRNGEDEGGGDGEARLEERTPEEREKQRVRSAERLGRRSNATSVDLGRLLSATVEAWCLPEHRFCRIPSTVLEGIGSEGAGVDRGEEHYERICSLMSLITQEHAMRLPEGLKRRKLANGLTKAKYSPSVEPSETCLEEDEVQALAPSRVLLGIALGLARAGLVADATKELVKAAVIRPRNVTADTPRDRSIALIAPAATALCLALPRSSCGGGCKDSVSGTRATLFGVLAGCMRDALDLLAIVLDGASRLGQAVSTERLERPRSAIGLVASCTLLALRHLGPLSPPPSTGSPSNAENFGRGDNSGDTQCSACDPLDPLRSAAAAAGTFVEVLGCALEKRFSDRLGAPALTTVMSALLHCWPPSSISCIGSSPSSTIVVDSEERTGEKENSVVMGDRGYEAGPWNLEQDSSLRNNSSSEGRVGLSSTVSTTSTPNMVPFLAGVAIAPSASAGAPAAIPSYGEGRGSYGGGGITQQEEKDELKDEYGSWDDFVDDPDLDALLTGSTPSQPAVQSREMEAEAKRRKIKAEVEAANMQVAAKIVAKAEEKEKLWRSLAEGANVHVLPHLHEILKRTFTSARYSQVPSSVNRRLAVGLADTVKPRALPAGPRVSATLGASASCPSSVHSFADSGVDPDVVLELHATAAFVSLRGNGIPLRNSSAGVSQGEKNIVFEYHAVREKYLDVHRMPHNPLVPQQRLLAPAFFCLVLDHARGADNGCRDTVGIGFSRDRAPLAEALRGKEWDILQLWMQAAFDPSAFPERQRRGNRGLRRRSRGQGWRRSGGSSVGVVSDPAELVRKRFEGFTRSLSTVFGFNSGVTAGCGEGAGQGSRAPLLDADIAGVFEKRQTRFESAHLAALSQEEALVLKRVLDVQSVVVHCGGLWAAALVITGPTTLPEADRKRIKDRVVRLTHSTIKSLRRFLPEVFPRGEAAKRSKEPRTGSENREYNGAGLHPSRYGSTFRRLYGHAAYAFAAFLMRTCGGALKGLPLRELVETFFESIACRPSVGSGDRSEGASGPGKNNGGVTGAAGGGIPNVELTALAVMHLPDLLQCFSEMPMTVAPVADWIKNINDHAINGNAPSPTAISSSGGGSAAAPLIISMASGLRGNLLYPSRPSSHPFSRNSPPVSVFGDLAAAASLAPSPHLDTTVLSNRLARMRLEILGDRKLRVAWFLLEVATAGTSGAGRGVGGRAGEHRVFVGKIRRLLVLLAEMFRCRTAGSRRHEHDDHRHIELHGSETGAVMTNTSTVDYTSVITPLPSTLTPVTPQPPLEFLRDILPLVRPVYAILGEALLGEPGPARRLSCEALAIAAALALAGLDYASASRAAVQTAESRSERSRRERVNKGAAKKAIEAVSELQVAECFAEVVVLAVSAKLNTFLAAMGTDDYGIGKNDGDYDSVREATDLADLSHRESELEEFLVGFGVWDCHGQARGWPHHSLPTMRLAVATVPRLAEGQVKNGDDDTPLSALLEEAAKMVAACRVGLEGRVRNGVVLRCVERVLVPRIEACRRLLLSGEQKSSPM